jgi:hypothetical protein
LKTHTNVAVYTLQELSKKQAKQLARALQALQGLPWKIAILIDSTLQHRASLHPENAKKFNHGKGFVIGHQWTNIVLIINDILIPLSPIPYYSERYCREHGLDYQTEHELVVDYLNHLDLEDYIGAYTPRDVVVLTDSGYDDKKIETTIVNKHWNFIIALKKTRSVKSETLYLTTPKSRQWCPIATFFRNHRRLKWTTIRLMTNGAKRKRMEFRIRHTLAYLRYVGPVQLVCSEFKKRPEGRRKYLACSDLRVTARQIVMGYRLRWAVEIYQSCNLRRTLFWQKMHIFDFLRLQSVKILDNELEMSSLHLMILSLDSLWPSSDSRHGSCETLSSIDCAKPKLCYTVLSWLGASMLSSSNAAYPRSRAGLSLQAPSRPTPPPARACSKLSVPGAGRASAAAHRCQPKLTIVRTLGRVGL